MITAYPFRRVRFRTDLEREDVVAADVNLRRDAMLGGVRGYWKGGAKLVTRDKSQNRDNQNYTGSTFTLGDFGLSGPDPGRFFDNRSRFGPTLDLDALQQFFAENPARFTFDALTTKSDSLVQDFGADEQVIAGYLMRTFELDRWTLLAGIRLEHTNGDPALKPYESMNLDGSIEYYLGSGLVAVAPFYKHIDNPIYGRSFVENDVVYENRFYEQLGFSQPANAEAGHIGGVELTYQNYFTRLPAPLDGLGVNLNHTVTSSSVRIFGRDDELPFFKQSNHIGNVSLLYEKFGVATQVSLSFNSPSLGSVGSGSNSDNYGDTYRVLDFKFSAPITRGLRGMVEVGDLNDEHRRRYAGVSARRVQDEVYSWNLLVGVDWRLR